MNIEQFCDKLEVFLQTNILPEDMKECDLYFEWDWDSETYWIKLGLNEEWFDDEDDDCDNPDCKECN